MRNTIVIPQGFDAHTHQRNNEMMELVLPFTLKAFPDFLAMPNLAPTPLVYGEQSMLYKETMLNLAEKAGLECRPLVTIKYETGVTTPDVIYNAKKLGVTAIKFYPEGVTTNSTGGVRDFKLTYPILEAAQECGLMVLWHGEHPDSEIMEREIHFLEFFKEAVRDFPDLKQVLEHLSTKEAVQCIKDIESSNVGATITAHHLWKTLTDMAGGNFKVHLMCKPILKNNPDKLALIDAATGDDPRFFFGSDTAPHRINAKHCADVCSGVFTAPFALPLLAELFEDVGRLDMLQHFVSLRGRSFYGLDLPPGLLTLVQEEWTEPLYYHFGSTVVGSASDGKVFRYKLQ